MNNLKAHIKRNLPNLKGKWVQKNSSYEQNICKILGMRHEKSRYWDGAWKTYRIEFKKGRSIWLNLVRYSEILLRKNEDAKRETIALFFVPNKDRTKIEEVICVSTENLIKRVKLNKENANVLIKMAKLVRPRSLNAQTSLTISDVREIQLFSV